jgi:ribosomal protein S18 acetylase RimI-like enzyme
MTTITIDGPCRGQAARCEPILRALPEWFGIEAAIQQYVRDVDALPTFLARADDQVVGFLTLMQHNPYAAEIHVMGVTPAWHRRHVGQALLTKAEAYLRRRNVEYLQVKTLSATHPDAHYARTRAFYRAMGFRPLQEFPTLWDEANPCLQMVKWLGASRIAVSEGTL